MHIHVGQRSTKPVGMIAAVVVHRYLGMVAKRAIIP
jgi:hypothetical protein